MEWFPWREDNPSACERLGGRLASIGALGAGSGTGCEARRGKRSETDEEPAATDGEREVTERDAAREILEAMDRLPAEHRAVLALFAIEGFRQTEIAEVLGIPEGTVWSRLHAARVRLAAELGGRRSEK